MCVGCPGESAGQGLALPQEWVSHLTQDGGQCAAGGPWTGSRLCEALPRGLPRVLGGILSELLSPPSPQAKLRPLGPRGRAMGPPGVTVQTHSTRGTSWSFRRAPSREEPQASRGWGHGSPGHSFPGAWDGRLGVHVCPAGKEGGRGSLGESSAIQLSDCRLAALWGRVVSPALLAVGLGSLEANRRGLLCAACSTWPRPLPQRDSCRAEGTWRQSWEPARGQEGGVHPWVLLRACRPCPGLRLYSRGPCPFILGSSWSAPGSVGLQGGGSANGAQGANLVAKVRTAEVGDTASGRRPATLEQLSPAYCSVGVFLVSLQGSEARPRLVSFRGPGSPVSWRLD
ncbi:uncharacterized protein LOC125614717 [Marmota marmota marmota]|uniref:uncharacterized protein LOC125614717 n=1 Tax=Marmota marmota marmota TaxID=9994 RepID=UPI0020935AC0|nr:uncharacterized protein LOC125614717 [Marmota marmota marmota]